MPTNREIAERAAREIRELIICEDCKTRGIPGTSRFNWPLCDACLIDVSRASASILRAIEEGRQSRIKRMVDRFLGWKLPENFNPDGGISFKKAINENRPSWPQKNEPTGTNLFDATQAEAMVRYMVEESQGHQEPSTPQPAPLTPFGAQQLCQTPRVSSDPSPKYSDYAAPIDYHDALAKWTLRQFENGEMSTGRLSCVFDCVEFAAKKRTGGADTRELREALRKLRHEVLAILGIASAPIRATVGDTNMRVLNVRLAEAERVLAQGEPR